MDWWNGLEVVTLEQVKEEDWIWEDEEDDNGLVDW